MVVARQKDSICNVGDLDFPSETAYTAICCTDIV